MRSREQILQSSSESASVKKLESGLVFFKLESSDPFESWWLWKKFTATWPVNRPVSRNKDTTIFKKLFLKIL